jgi:hypothetical protein
METPFLVGFDYIVLYFDEKTPALAGTQMEIPFYFLGDAGDVVAVFHRFPSLDRDAWVPVPFEEPDMSWWENEWAQHQEQSGRLTIEEIEEWIETERALQRGWAEESRTEINKREADWEIKFEKPEFLTKEQIREKSYW